MINKNTYLDAMGISRWSLKSNKEQLVVLTDDIDLTKKSRLVAEVLMLMGYSAKSCVFASKTSSLNRVVWDMRLVNRPHKQGILYSSPLMKLQTDPKGKAELWQQLWQHYLPES